MKKMRMFTDEQKAKFASETNRMRTAGESIQAIATTLGISTSSVIRYLGKGSQRGGKTVTRTYKKRPKTLLPSPVEIMQRPGMMVIAIGSEDLVANSLHLIAHFTGGH